MTKEDLYKIDLLKDVDYGFEYLPDEHILPDSYLTIPDLRQDRTVMKHLRKLHGLLEDYPCCPYCSRPLQVDNSDQVYCQRCCLLNKNAYVKREDTGFPAWAYKDIPDAQLPELNMDLLNW